MRSLYVDASALLRVVFAEPGIAAPLQESRVVVASSSIITVEAAQALHRAYLSRALDDSAMAIKSADIRDTLATFHLRSVDEGVIDLARSPFGVSLRAVDALHIATAQVLTREVGPLEFWTHDKRQGLAAMSRGLDVRGVELTSA